MNFPGSENVEESPKNLVGYSLKDIYLNICEIFSQNYFTPWSKTPPIDWRISDFKAFLLWSKFLWIWLCRVCMLLHNLINCWVFGKKRRRNLQKTLPLVPIFANSLCTQKSIRRRSQTRKKSVIPPQPITHTLNLHHVLCFRRFQYLYYTYFRRITKLAIELAILWYKKSLERLQHYFPRSKVVLARCFDQKLHQCQLEWMRASGCAGTCGGFPSCLVTEAPPVTEVGVEGRLARSTRYNPSPIFPARAPASENSRPKNWGKHAHRF